MRGEPAPLTKRVTLGPDADPRLTLRPLWDGPGDPTMRIEDRVVLRATLTPAGPASLRLVVGRGDVTAEAWGAGAQLALDAVPALLGQHDDPSRLVPRHRAVAELAHRFAGLRMTRSDAVTESLVRTVVAQKVTAYEARRGYRMLVRRFGRPAPGPLGLLCPPEPADLAGAPYHLFHPLGIERRRAETISRVAARAAELERLTEIEPEVAQHRLTTLPGVGRWTAAETVRLALGDPDAVSIGDYNLPHLVAWTLAGEPRASDDQMLELLEPYRGQRARVALLLVLGGRYPPRRAPRLAPRRIAGI